MTGVRPADILRQLEQPGPPDAELLARFAQAKDAQAFAELVRRHAPLVLGVCRRVTGQAQDAEDAFQATFLVLAQKAGSLRNAALLGNWLYGVAFRVAWRARRSAARRRKREVPVSALPEVPAPSPSSATPELAPILDEELAALAACYRDTIILCDLRGVSREEAAAALGIPEGTLSSRLANGRKKLAARLARRGIALPAAALAGAISEAQAATAVPNELVAKTCGLVAEWSAGGAVPGPLAKLAEGGLTVRKTFLLVAVMAFAVGGAVLAARPDEDAPPVDPPKPPVAQKPDPAPQPKEEPKPGDKSAVKYTNAPRMRAATDIQMGGVTTAAWSQDGQFFAVQGNVPTGAKDEYMSSISLLVVHENELVIPDYSWAKYRGGGLVGFTPDSRELVTEKREYHLVSGFHWLRYRSLPVDDVGKALNVAHNPVVRTVNLDLPETHGYAFAPDGKTFRTVALHRNAGGLATKLEVLEVDAKTGKAAKSLLKTDYGRHMLSANGKRLAVVDNETTKVTVYNIDRGAKVSEYKFPVQAPKPPARVAKPALLSGDGSRVAVHDIDAPTYVLNADSGEPIAIPDALSTPRPSPLAFSGDGRLLAMTGRVKGQEAGSLPNVLAVWDTQTGKVLKSWRYGVNQSPRVLFHPTKPLLAILEPSGENLTRVGFWDFAAEVEKK